MDTIRQDAIVDYARLSRFIEIIEAQGIALSFDEMLSAPGFSDVLPKGARLDFLLHASRPASYSLHFRAMKTVTETRMAIEMASRGGIGVIHRAATDAEQSDMVDKVKYNQNGFISKPRTIRARQTVGDLMQMRRTKGFDFHRFPVLDDNGKFVGLVTRNDLQFCGDNPSALIEQIMTPLDQLIVSDDSITKEEAFAKMKLHKKESLPVILRDGTPGLYLFKYLERVLSGRSIANVDENGQLRVAAAVGVGDDEMERVERLLKSKCDVIVVDTAHGHSAGVKRMVTSIRSNFPDAQIVAGNICTEEAALDLVAWGADAVKVGIGPGSICTTRIVTGIGWPQLDAIGRVFLALKRAGLGHVPVIADGGLTSSADVAKAFMFGASATMFGGLLAGTDETPGEVVLGANGRDAKKYSGMGSPKSMRELKAARERYSQSELSGDSDKLVPEGVDGEVPYKGPASLILNRLIGGVRSSMGYLGARTIDEMPMKVRPTRISESGKRESGVHDVQVVGE